MLSTSSSVQHNSTASVPFSAERRRQWALAAGCECASCDLRNQVPVPSEIRSGARFLAVGEAPGEQELRDGMPFVGPSGRQLMNSLWACGMDRTGVSLTNVIACRPPREWRRYAAEYRQRLAGDMRSWPPARCRPRLRREVAEARAVLLLGAQALDAAIDLGLRIVRPGGEEPEAIERTGHGESGLSRLRGFPLELDGKPAVTTWHPAFLLRVPRFTEIAQRDVGKVSRLAAGRGTWREPEIVCDPDLATFDLALARLSASKLVAVDTETDGLDPESCNLRCVGLGVVGFGVAVGFVSCERPARSWQLSVERSRERLGNFLRADGRGLVLHNQAFDRRVLERHGMALPASYGGVIDTLAADHVVNSEWPHDLGFLESAETDAPAHKAVDHAAWSSDQELHSYCVRDCVVTAELAPRLARGVVESGQRAVYESDLELQRLAVGMHRAGITIDLAERRRHSERLEAACATAQERADRAIDKSIRLSNIGAVRDYLFGTSGQHLEPESETDGGSPSVDKDALYGLLERPGLPSQLREFVESNLDFRRAWKKLTAYTGREIGTTWVGGPPIGADGRVRSTFNATGTLVGRLASSRPNMQTIPATRDDLDSLRSMFCAGPGNVLVACDLDQLHLRIIAVRANDRPWLDAFARRHDVHRANAGLFFGRAYEEVRDYERQYMKTIAYLFVYAGGADRARKQLLRLRDPKTGARPYANKSHDDVAYERGRFLATHAALKTWWRRECDEFRRAECLRSMQLGRVRRFLDLRFAPRLLGHGEGDRDDSISELVNYPVISTEGDLMGGAGASGRAMEAIGWPWDAGSRGRGMGGPGIVLQNHDSIMVEVSEFRALEAAAALKKAMTTRLKWEDREVEITASVKIGRKWSET